MTRLAVYTEYGLNTGGTEKYLQTIAANVNKEKFIVDFYYIDDDSKVSKVKKQYLMDRDVNLIAYTSDEPYEWKRFVFHHSDDFFKKFKGADIILTGSNGFPEEILTHIRNIPILQSIHYVSGIDWQFNIARVLHISEFSKRMWERKGGDSSRVVMVSHPIEIPKYSYSSIRKKFNISENTFVFGMHQRDNDFIFSEIPLKAYSLVETDETAYVLCGGSKKYREQASKLGLKHCYFIDATDSNDVIYSFLQDLNVYAHGRYDGELNSTALAEAMYFGLPIISHPSQKYNGHLEVINENGIIANTYEEYAEAMKKMMIDAEMRKRCAEESKKMFEMKYDLNVQIIKFESICEDVLQNPYPHKIKRMVLNWVSIFMNFMKIESYRRVKHV